MLVSIQYVPLTFAAASDWEKVKSPAKDQVVDYNTLPEASASDASILDKVCVRHIVGVLLTQYLFHGSLTSVHMRHQHACRNRSPS